MYGVNLKLAPVNIGFLFVGGETEPGKKTGGGIGLEEEVLPVTFPNSLYLDGWWRNILFRRIRISR